MIRCADCALTISELPFTLEVDLRAVEHGGLCCPACGARAPLKAPLAELGVFSRQGRLCRWVEQGDPSLLRIGRMGLRLLDVEALDLRRVSYPALPLLLGRDGRPNTSLLPIRPEYADLIEAVEQAPRALGRVCTVGLRLRGRPGLTLLERPLTEPIPGLRVALWPDVPLTEWRFYLLGAWLDEASVLEGHVLELSSGAAALSLRPGATRAVAQLEGRPGAVGLRLTTADRFEAGGIFLVPQASRGLPATGRVVVGLDFGTSNTHLAWAAGDDLGSSIAAEIKAVPWADRDRVLHDGAERPTGRLGPETWPPVQGFDPAASTFPSALLCARPAASLDPSARGWRLGEDYGLVHIPAVGESPALPYDEGEHLVTNLKWEPRTNAGRLPDDQTRQHYLSAVMLLALANLVADPRVHAREVELRWSYPAVFERQNRLEGQARAMEAVAAQLSRWTGLSVHANRGADEATVASAGSTSQFATDVLYVDVGGGTVDVLFGRYAAGERAHHGSRQPIYALSSFRFAGDDYVDMLVEGRFLDPNLSRERFLRAVRTAPRLDQDFGRRTLNGSRLDPARSRTVLFFGYLIEHMARLIAARLLDGSRLDTPDGRYVVSVSLLGNGWAFVGLTTADPHAWLQQKLSARVEQLLRAEADPPAGSARALGLPWAVECSRGGEVQPKQVVAQGLLRSMGDERRQDLRSRNILGLSTFVGQRYPWYLPIVDTWSDTDLRLSRHAPLAEGHRAWWRPEDDPGFAANLPGLHEVDPELRQSYAHLCRRVLPGPGDDWFVRNALEVVLEDVVRPQLSRISKVSVP